MTRTLNQWVEYIQTLHPRTIDLSLDRVACVWEKFKPACLPPVITVAGTNGKGSSVSMLEFVYRQAGYRTASFTSPHLVSFNERICMDNVPVSDAVLLASFLRIEALRANITLTSFEFNTLLALDIFCANEPDVIILEVGMGGRLDAVNIVDSDLALITAIDIDHSAWLGDSREHIALEKAGVIKPGAMAVLADPDAPRGLIEVAVSRQANFVEAGADFRMRVKPDGNRGFSSEHPKLKYFCDLEISAVPQHIQHNTAGVVAAIALLQSQLPVTLEQLQSGLASQHLDGRLQWIAGEPAILLDVSHNEASVLAMLEYIDTLQLSGRIHAVFGALADKNYGAAYSALKCRIDAWYLTALQGERGQDAVALSERLFGSRPVLREGTSVALFDTPEQAFSRAKSRAMNQDLLLIFGSFHVVGAIIPILNS